MRDAGGGGKGERDWWSLQSGLHAKSVYSISISKYKVSVSTHLIQANMTAYPTASNAIKPSGLYYSECSQCRCMRNGMKMMVDCVLIVHLVVRMSVCISGLRDTHWKVDALTGRS